MRNSLISAYQDGLNPILRESPESDALVARANRLWDEAAEASVIHLEGGLSLRWYPGPARWGVNYGEQREGTALRCHQLFTGTFEQCESYASTIGAYLQERNAEVTRNAEATTADLPHSVGSTSGGKTQMAGTGERCKECGAHLEQGDDGRCNRCGAQDSY